SCSFHEDSRPRKAYWLMNGKHCDIVMYRIELIEPEPPGRFIVVRNLNLIFARSIGLFVGRGDHYHERLTIRSRHGYIHPPMEPAKGEPAARTSTLNG